MAGARDQPRMRSAGRRPCVHVFADTLRWGRAMARAIGASCAAVAVHRFPDGESLVRVRTPAGRDAILVRSLYDPNAKLVETLLAADALRRAGARRVTLVAPYLSYMRQDAVFAPGEPVSQRVVGELLRRSFDRVLTVEPHLHRVRRLRDVIPRAGQSVSAAPAVAAWLRRTEYAAVVGPDEESAPWVEAIARAAGVPWAVGRKARHGDRSVTIRLPALPSTGAVVVVDDIASSGGTLASVARALHRRGVRGVDAVVVHPIFAPRALGAIRAAGVRRVVSCDTIPHATNAIPTAALVAHALQDGA